ncbi:hypothetical protein FHS94_003700 [Sphingomonas aerophila]|uniref:Uncharacterized protein n=1 Tax=Sphingomonas aerophila TaxID=1344948 RepID=A0A7W9EXR6_9SPHN|nr:hypothetical protein [Sphingomonas aerophila]
MTPAPGSVTAGSDLGSQFEAVLPSDTSIRFLREPIRLTRDDAAAADWHYRLSDHTIRLLGSRYAPGYDFSDQYEALVEKVDRASADGEIPRTKSISRAVQLLRSSEFDVVNILSGGTVMKQDRPYALGDEDEFKIEIGRGLPSSLAQVAIQDSVAYVGLTNGSAFPSAEVRKDVVAYRTGPSYATCRRIIRGDWYDPAFLAGVAPELPHNTREVYFGVSAGSLRYVPYCILIMKSPTVRLDAPFAASGVVLPTSVYLGGSIDRLVVDARQRPEGGWSAVGGGEFIIVGIAFSDSLKPGRTGHD